MKKLISVMLAALLTVTSIGAVSLTSAQEGSTENSQKTAVNQLTENGSTLPNVYAKMRQESADKKTIRVGYFGGSVTVGYGGTDQHNDSWRGLSLKWFNETYGEAYNVEFVESTLDSNVRDCAGLSGTGTDLNVFRANKRLGLTENNPYDLVFIEFAINDSYEQSSYAKSAYYMESIIHKIRHYSPTTDIVIVITTDYGKKGTEFVNGKAHADVAEHYNVPVFWIGKYMWPFLVEEAGTENVPANAHPWTTYYMSPGDCHPNNAGYQKYFEFLRENLLKPALDQNDNYTTDIVEYTIPETHYNETEKFKEQDTGARKYSDIPLLSVEGSDANYDAKWVTYDEVEGHENAFGGFTQKEATITTYDAGSSFRAVFNSTSAGILYNGINTNGGILYSVDGGEYKFQDLYSTRADGSREYFMFYENLEPGEHTVDVILRRTASGTRCTLDGFILCGDSENVSFVSPAPTKALNDEVYVSAITLTPDMVKEAVSGNNAATFDNYHLGVIDLGVLRYVPNTESNQVITSSCTDSATLASVNLSRYHYAVIDYYYEVGNEGNAGAEGNRQAIRLLMETPNSQETTSIDLYAADTIVKNQRAYSIIDLNAVKAKLGYEGAIKEVQIMPYGDVCGNELTEADAMNIVDVSFYPDYPTDIRLNSNQIYKTEIEVDVNKEIGTTAEEIDISSNQILPSAHKYATVKYTAEEDTTLTIEFKNLYNIETEENGKNFTITKDVKASETEVIVSFEKIANSGQSFYYNTVELSSENTVEVNSIKFSVDYPDPDAEFAITFDANGGTGDVPEPITDKIGTEIVLPNSFLEKD